MMRKYYLPTVNHVVQILSRLADVNMFDKVCRTHIPDFKNIPLDDNIRCLQFDRHYLLVSPENKQQLINFILTGEIVQDNANAKTAALDLQLEYVLSILGQALFGTKTSAVNCKPPALQPGDAYVLVQHQLSSLVFYSIHAIEHGLTSVSTKVIDNSKLAQLVINQKIELSANLLPQQIDLKTLVNLQPGDFLLTEHKISDPILLADQANNVQAQGYVAVDSQQHKLIHLEKLME